MMEIAPKYVPEGSFHNKYVSNLSDTQQWWK